MTMSDDDKRQLRDDTDRIMLAVNDAVNKSVEFAILQHSSQCAAASMRDQHDRMYKELMNGDDGKSGFFAEMRSFVIAWNTRETDKDKRKKRRWIAAAVIVPVLCIILAEPASVGWKKIEALSDLAAQAPDIIKLTADWKRFYETPLVHQMDPAPIITPPNAQTYPKHPRPKKPQKSFFEYDPSGVGLMQAPDPPQEANKKRETW